MKPIAKRIFAVLMAAVLLLFCVPASAETELAADQSLIVAAGR